MRTSVPLPFVHFCERVGVRLTPGQRVLARVAFDGVDPVALVPEEREIANRLFGNVDIIPVGARGVVTIVAGARGGKSFLGALRMLHLGLTGSLDTLGPGERAAGLIIAPELRLARQVLGYVRGVVRGIPDLARAIESDTTDRIVLRRGKRRVALECVPASRGGAAGRGRSLVGAVLDESAFFKDANFVVNDHDVFAAVAPRVMPGGQVLITSTPWAEAGLLYEEWKRNFGQPRSSLVVHAPTLELRDDENTRQMVGRERERDPHNADREFNAVFQAVGSGAVFDSTMIDHAVDARRPECLPADPALPAWAGLDLGFNVDSTALVIVRLRPDKRLEVAELLELRPRRGEPLRPTEVLSGRIAPLCQRHGVSVIVTDAHYQALAREHLSGRVRIRLVPAGAEGKREMYDAARDAIHSQRVIIPRVPRLIQQLKEVRSKPLAGGGVRIESPRWRRGGHGDLASALVAALWSACKVRPGSVVSGVHMGPRREAVAQFGDPNDYSPSIGIGSDGKLRFVRRRPRDRWSRGGF